MKTDFCSAGGYLDMMGYDLSMTQAPIAPIRALLTAMRAKGYTIIRIGEGLRPHLSDLPPNKSLRPLQIFAGPCSKPMICGEAGLDIILELYPAPGEIVIDKPGKGKRAGQGKVADLTHSDMAWMLIGTAVGRIPAARTGKKVAVVCN